MSSRKTAGALQTDWKRHSVSTRSLLNCNATKTRTVTLSVSPWITTQYEIRNNYRTQAKGQQKGPKGRQSQPQTGNGHQSDPTEPTGSPTGTSKDQGRSPETARRAPNRPRQAAQTTPKTAAGSRRNRPGSPTSRVGFTTQAARQEKP